MLHLKQRSKRGWKGYVPLKGARKMIQPLTETSKKEGMNEIQKHAELPVLIQERDKQNGIGF